MSREEAERLLQAIDEDPSQIQRQRQTTAPAASAEETVVRRLIVVLGFGFGFVLGPPAQGLVQTARAYLSQNEVTLNQQFVLNVEISGTQQLDQDPVLPDLSAFAAFLGSGTSTSMQIVNGRTSISLTVQYRFQATAEGTFEIGPVTLRAGGLDLRTEPLTIRIVDGPAPDDPVRPTGGGLDHRAGGSVRHRPRRANGGCM